MRCSHPDCSWRAIAPSDRAAWTQYAEHLVTEHARTVDADIPEGMVQIKLDGADEWVTATVEEARELHDAVHEE
ncbi:MAG: hypothetical protein ABEJ82_01505 [Haloplanus sp.]